MTAAARAARPASGPHDHEKGDVIGAGVRLLTGALWHHAGQIRESLDALGHGLLADHPSTQKIREHLIALGLRAEQMRAVARAAESELARRAGREPERGIR